jgi:hypothetical protein
MLIKFLVALLAAAMAVFTAISAVDAIDYYSTYTQPAYYRHASVGFNEYYLGSYYDALPVMQGPYSRHYHLSSSPGFMYLHDDFNHFDTFVGYQDLDVYYPARGYIDVLKNQAGSLSPVDPTFKLDFRQANTMHVYGALPGGGVYRKHYYHDHASEIEFYYPETFFNIIFP